MRPGLSISLVGLISFGVCAALSLLVDTPQPHIHDEFSYLLAGDTFAHGRLTNPTHPLWVHFESMHIIHQPTYASKYPPGQGLVLAAGQAICGHPIVGVWLSTALACGATCWMLMAWLPPRWALLGGLLAVVHPTIVSWGQSYWGGSLAMLGGTLVLGALPRIIRTSRVRDALAMGVGMAVLANSRPYEGMVLSLLSLAALMVWLLGRPGPKWRMAIARVMLPIIVVLAPTAAAMGLYNLRVTGSAFLMPYVVHEATYGAAPLFLWQDAGPAPNYRHATIGFFHEYLEKRFFIYRQTPSGLASTIIESLFVLFRGFFPTIALQVPLVTLPWVLRDRRMRLALLGCGAFALALLPETWMQPHYAAPAFGMALVFIVQSLRRLRLWRYRGRPTGRLVTRTCLTMCVVMLVPFDLQRARSAQEGSLAQLSRRALLLQRLEQDERRHLVIVRYEPLHDPVAEWVYNEADIDGAKVIWAREMDAVQNRKLLAYFKDRRVWLVEPDASPPRLMPYPVQRPP